MISHFCTNCKLYFSTKQYYSLNSMQNVIFLDGWKNSRSGFPISCRNIYFRVVVLEKYFFFAKNVFLPFIFSSSCFIQNYENIFKSRIYDSVLIQSDFTALCAKHSILHICTYITRLHQRSTLVCLEKPFLGKIFFFLFRSSCVCVCE